MSQTGTEPTREQVKTYLDHGGSRCLYCESDEVEADSPECDGTVGWANVRCGTCKSEWTDQWRLTGVSAIS